MSPDLTHIPSIITSSGTKTATNQEMKNQENLFTDCEFKKKKNKNPMPRILRW